MTVRHKLTSKPYHIMNIDERIYNQLTNNTGTHMLDSGGAYGRHWQHNKEKTLEDFQNDPVYEFDFWNDENGLDFYHIKSVFHHVTETLQDVDSDVRELWDEYYDLCMNHQDAIETILGESFGGRFTNEMSYYEIRECFSSYLYEKGHDVKDTYIGQGTVNTYNGEDALSQTLLFSYFSVCIDGFDHTLVVLQTHNGADVRGGYSYPEVYESEWDLGHFFMYNDAYIDIGDHSWYTDDGYHWYGSDRGTEDLEDWNQIYADGYDPVVVSKANPNSIVYTDDNLFIDGESFLPHDPDEFYFDLEQQYKLYDCEHYDRRYVLETEKGEFFIFDEQGDGVYMGPDVTAHYGAKSISLDDLPMEAREYTDTILSDPEYVLVGETQ